MQKITTNNPFFAAALSEVPRLLGQIDRNPLSRTYGSCDRAFWLYRTNDINSMRYQEAALTLSLLYSTQFEGNTYYHDEHLLSVANAAIRFASLRQHNDGSFDEWYLNEGSFVCTAFVSAALSEAAFVLGDKLKDRDKIIAALKKSGVWLMQHTETLVVNQLAGAIVALHNISVLTGDTQFKEAAKKKCDTLLSLQHAEGWWSEYGGPDIGYLSLTIDYLSRYVARTRHKEVQAAIEKASAFLLHFIHPDGTAGGEYMERNTEYLIPSGFLRSLSYSKSSRAAASFVAGLLGEEKGITPRALDDRYLCYILYNWIEAGILWSNIPDKPIPSAALVKSSGRKFFSDAGLFVERNNTYQIFVNLKKGGSLRLYAQDSVLIDSGISLCLKGSVYAGNVLRQNTRILYDERDSLLRSEGRFIRMRAPLLTTGPAIVLKVFQLLFGRPPLFQEILKRVLRLVGILRPGLASQLRYERIVSVQPDTVTITDTLNTIVPEKSFVVGEANTFALVPSSRYATVGAPQKYLKPESESFEVIDGSTRLTRVFTL